MQVAAKPILGAHSQHQFPSPMESFTWLCDSIPEWLEKLEVLAQQVQTRQDEFEKLSIDAASSFNRFSKRKTGSTESLRANDKVESSGISPTPHANTTSTATTPISPIPKIDVNPNNRRLFQEYREAARRKRKSTSIHSNASGPVKFRARMAMVIYYDSDVQSGFESMVRCLASARNTLRKGKNATSYKARMASLAEEESPFDGGRSRMSIRNPRIPRFQKSSGPYSMDSLSLEQFDMIDKELEVAQTLCEVGAHQFLRDASSMDELGGVRDKMMICLKLSKEGYDIMKVEGDKEKAAVQESLNKESFEVADHSGDVEIDCKGYDSRAYTDSAMGIEIDDDDDDGGIEIDLPGPDIDLSTMVDTKTLKISPDTNKAFDMRHELLGTGTGMIEVDASSDEEEQPFKIDLSLVRRTR